jgi:hypothetical protein
VFVRRLSLILRYNAVQAKVFSIQNQKGHFMKLNRIINRWKRLSDKSIFNPIRNGDSVVERRETPEPIKNIVNGDDYFYRDEKSLDEIDFRDDR